MLSRISCAVLILTCCAFSAWAQAPSSIGSNTELKVRVVYENDRAVPQNLTVELLSASGTTVQSRMTDAEGRVSFKGLDPARYKLRVRGDGIVTTETMVVMEEMAPNFTQYVRVRKLDAGVNPGFTVTTTELQVPKEAKKEFDKASDSMERKQWAEAQAHFERALALYPKYALAHSGLAMAYLNLGQGEKAVASFRAALDIDQNLREANVYLGHFYYDNRKYKDAEPYLAKAAELDPRNAQVLTALANSELQNGEPDQALANAKKVHTLPDHNKYAVAHLIAAEVLTAKNDTKQVAEEYRLFLKEDPHSPLAERVRGALAKLEPASK